ncbi:MAG: glycosyltransferase family 1 protein [Methylococcales bacterium]
MRIAIITDAWQPQINGVVTTLTNTCKELEKLEHTVKIFDPSLFRAIPCPGYQHFRLAFLCGPRLRPIVEQFKPDAIHITTEGPVGYAARRYCLYKGYRYTTSLHSRYPEYLNMRVGFPLLISYTYLRWFHRKSAHIMVATESLQRELSGRKYKNLVRWSLGVDTELFQPDDKSFIQDKRPISMYTGRVAIEKNVEAFLRLDLPGTKYVIGDGPQREAFINQYPNVRFVGYKQGKELARYMAAADVFVFPSKTDTFGLVLLEALACGVPVAAYPVSGPSDVIGDPRVSTLDNNLQTAALKSLSLNVDDCRRYALNYSWQHSASQFAENLVAKNQ